MLEITNSDKKRNGQIVHDVNASISALHGAIELIKDEWRSNPELVDKILPLTIEKLHQLQFQLEKFKSTSS